MLPSHLNTRNFRATTVGIACGCGVPHSRKWFIFGGQCPAGAKRDGFCHLTMKSVMPSTCLYLSTAVFGEGIWGGG